MTRHLLFSWKTPWWYGLWTKNVTNIARWQCDSNLRDIDLYTKNRRSKVRMEETSTWSVNFSWIPCSSLSASINNKLLIRINLKNWKQNELLTLKNIILNSFHSLNIHKNKLKFLQSYQFLVITVVNNVDRIDPLKNTI